MWIIQGMEIIPIDWGQKVKCTGQWNSKMVSEFQSIVLFTYIHHTTLLELPMERQCFYWVWSQKVKGQVYCTLM
jgi:hypothetical protein